MAYRAIPALAVIWGGSKGVRIFTDTLDFYKFNKYETNAKSRPEKAILDRSGDFCPYSKVLLYCVLPIDLPGQFPLGDGGFGNI